MPRQINLVNVHPMPVRWLSVLLAGALSLPGPGVQAQSVNGQISDARNSDSNGNSNRAVGQGRLGCQDPEPNGGPLSRRQRNPEADRWGDITVAQPKIWQFERVSALLDGVLRDVEGVSVADLTQLDPSQQNAAALKFIQSALEVGVQYDQAAAVNAANTLSSYNALHASQLQQLNQYNAYMQTLTSERDT